MDIHTRVEVHARERSRGSPYVSSSDVLCICMHVCVRVRTYVSLSIHVACRDNPQDLGNRIAGQHLHMSMRIACVCNTQYIYIYIYIHIHIQYLYSCTHVHTHIRCMAVNMGTGDRPLPTRDRRRRWCPCPRCGR
jgi:hypothetical protein